MDSGSYDRLRDSITWWIESNEAVAEERLKTENPQRIPCALCRKLFHTTDYEIEIPIRRQYITIGGSDYWHTSCHASHSFPRLISH